MQVVVYDANVLYPSTLRDVLICVGLARLVQPKWSEQILDEVFRNLRANRPDLDPERLDRTRRLMNDTVRDFPSERLTTWGVHAQHPDDFLAGLHQDRPGVLSEVIVAIARTWGDDATLDDVLDRLAVDAPRSADLIRHALGGNG